MKKLSDRVAVITGGAQGLGKAIALAMAEEGANIVICDINAKTLPSAQAEIEANGVALSGGAVRRLVGRQRRQPVPASRVEPSAPSTFWSTTPRSFRPARATKRCAPSSTR